MFVNGRVQQLDKKTDEVSLTFHCSGTLEDNLNEFLCDAAEAVVHLYANYEEGGTPGDTVAADKLRQAVINSLDATICKWRA
jgi:hypothetical protein